MNKMPCQYKPNCPTLKELVGDNLEGLDKSPILSQNAEEQLFSIFCDSSENYKECKTYQLKDKSK